MLKTLHLAKSGTLLIYPKRLVTDMKAEKWWNGSAKKLLS